ncbi:MAG: DUF1302 family protein, partial [Deltaproteobacteria bacterium]|nr:DUF1302 family protein [Deltaproteobacteria bacterium]
MDPSDRKHGETRRALRGCAGVLPKAAGAAILVLAASSAQAFRVDTGNPDLKLSWDTTLKYSAAFRVEGQSDTLVSAARNPSNVNQDDGDRNFDRGLISNRFDLFSELDAIYKGFGLRLSGAAWYDFEYNRDTDNDSPGTYNAFSVSNRHFPGGTERLHGRKAEFL